MHQLCASTFVKDNVILAGDSAHLTNPIGGLGFTTGLLDAAYWGRVLGQILVEGKPTSLLDTYAEERRSVFLNYTNPTAIANRKRLVSMEQGEIRKREEFFSQLECRDPDRYNISGRSSGSYHLH